MPTPVSTARQCLTEEAARVLDDAVAVACRRFHVQTTSLHAVSTLLSLPSSLLRDACSRSRSPAYSSRFQFRALDLCVSVSLDRLPSSKASAAADHDPPPVSNSLMAAIKRSQASQRRQPEMYQFTHNNASSIYSISSIKVELKNFVISILDDPIVSRVLGDAGFRSNDIKLAILHPPAPPSSTRYFRGAGGRCPPLFLCNLTDSRSSVAGNIPFPRGGGDCDGDENYRRIGEILVKSSGRNPLLVGVCARYALAGFKKRMENGRGEGVLPGQLAGLDLICAQEEIKEFVSNGGSKEEFDSKVEELSSAVDTHSGPGVVVNIGELKVLVEAEAGAEDAVKCFVSKLSTLFKIYKNKMWLIGEAADYETYRKFLNRFPSLEFDWDLHPLPIISSRSSAAELYTKSRLLGSFVPFGGFFSTPSDLRSTMGITNTNKPFTRCSTCNEKYERELAVITRRGSAVSVADQHSSSLPSWLQMAKSDVSKTQTETTDEKAESRAKKLWLQKKWDDICQRLHQGRENPRPAASISNPADPCAIGLQYITEQKSKSVGLYSNDGLRSNLASDISGVSAVLQKTSSQEQNIKAPVGSQPTDHVSSSSISCVTTNLGLATSASTSQELKEKASSRAFSHSPPSEIRCRDGFYRGGDCKLTVQMLIEKVAWQREACYDVGPIISCKGNGEHFTLDMRRATWIGFVGPDNVGKWKMAEALAELMFGSKENLIAVDLSVQERTGESCSVFDRRLPDDISLRTGRKTVVDYIAERLSKKPRSVVLLENVDKTDDPLAQRSLSSAIRSGKFLDSHGREVSIVNAVFLITCNSTEEDQDQDSFVNFSGQRILEALNWQMQIVIEHVEGIATSKCNNTSTVTLATGKGSHKRKQNDTNDPITHKKPKSFLDLNVPLEEDIELNSDDKTILENSRSWLKSFLEQVDRKVSFKSFNFDALAEKLLHKISLSLQRLSGSSFRLEIDQEVMSQIIAASLCSDGEGPVDAWIKEVLGKACAEAQVIYSLHKQSCLKLVSCPGMTIDKQKQAPAIRLPKSINLG